MQTPKTVTYLTRSSRLRLVDAVYPPHTEYDTHTHEETYACVVLEGRYEEWTPRPREVTEGDEQRWRAGSRHAVRTGPGPVRILHVADPSGGDHLFDRPLRAGVLVQLAVALSSGPPAPNDDAGRLHLACLLTELEEEPYPEATPPWLRRARERLRDAHAGPVTLAELATITDRHPSHVTRAFRRTWGMTPGEYLRRIRVARAVEKLRRTELPLADIAFATGFSDQSHMGRWMRRYVGATPAQVRAGERPKPAGGGTASPWHRPSTGSSRPPRELLQEDP